MTRQTCGVNVEIYREEAHERFRMASAAIGRANLKVDEDPVQAILAASLAAERISEAIVALAQIAALADRRRVRVPADLPRDVEKP